MLIFFNKQVGVYPLRRLFPPNPTPLRVGLRHSNLSTVYTKIRIIIDTTKHFINLFIVIFISMEENYVKDMSPRQQKGWKIFVSMVRKKYRFINDIIITNRLDTYGTFLIVDIVFDLDNLTRLYDVSLPKNYVESPHLYSSLNNPYTYLMSYLDDEHMDQFGFQFNNEIETYMSRSYGTLPKEFKSTQYEFNKYGLSVIEKSVKESEYPMEFRIRNFIPVFNVLKYYNPGGEKDI